MRDGTRVSSLTDAAAEDDGAGLGAVAWALFALWTAGAAGVGGVLALWLVAP